jgi:tetratricopeptide (TPR) repeat protein
MNTLASTMRRLALVAALGMAAAGPARGDDSDAHRPAESPHACEDMTGFWPLWSALSAQLPAARPSVGRPFFPLAEIVAALHAVPLAGPPPPPGPEAMEYYRPRSYMAPQDTWHQTLPYARAGESYEKGDFADAIRQFDTIVQTGRSSPATASPYRAAAAYTAARAAFALGHMDDGVTRIDRILADASLAEFWLPAWNLVALMRYRTDMAPLAAAEMAQISRVLVTPTATLCADPPASDGTAAATIGKDVVKAAVADFYLVQPQPYPGSRELQQPGFDYARQDPVIDLLAHAPAYPAFEPGGLSEDYESGFPLLHAQRSPAWPALSDATAPDPVSRARWRATGNPLWALALGYEGAEQDLPALSDAILAARSWPDLTDRARASLIWALSAYRARILLRLDKQADAVAALAVPTAKEQAAIAKDPPDLVRGAFEALVNGGARYLLAHHRQPAARQWAISAATTLHWPVSEPLKPLLVTEPGELYRHPVLGLIAAQGEIRIGPWRSMFDSWSSAQMIDFARRDEVAPADRRALVGAAWMRAFALRHWDDVFAWLPDLRRAYPMLGPDIDLIDHVWLPANKRHLALRLAVRAPGLIALPSWSRPPFSPKPKSTVYDTDRPIDILVTDPFEPSDGNWWCTPDVDETISGDRTDLIRTIEADIDAAEPKPAAGDDATEDSQAQRDSRATRYAADIPLLRIGDGKELQALAEAGSSARRFAEDAVAWGQERGWIDSWFGSDADLPETLHLAVQATRIGCRSPEDNSPWSRAAFKLLHRRYPNSDWAKRTPYWYGIIQ